jgi:hypothetical protein
MRCYHNKKTPLLSEQGFDYYNYEKSLLYDQLPDFGVGLDADLNIIDAGIQ